MSKTFSAKLVIMFVFIIAMIKALSMSAHAAVTVQNDFLVFTQDSNNNLVSLSYNKCDGSGFAFAYYYDDMPYVCNVSKVSNNLGRLMYTYSGSSDTFDVRRHVYSSSGSFVSNNVTYYIYYFALSQNPPDDNRYVIGLPVITFNTSVVQSAKDYLDSLGSDFEVASSNVDAWSGLVNYLKLKNTSFNGGGSSGTTNLTTIEQYLQTIDNNIGTSKVDISDIKTDVNYIRQNGTSGSGITQDIKDLMVRYDIWLTLIFFAVGLSLFRVVLRSVGDKFSRMR